MNIDTDQAAGAAPADELDDKELDGVVGGSAPSKSKSGASSASSAEKEKTALEGSLEMGIASSIAKEVESGLGKGTSSDIGKEVKGP